ncbi:MAG: SAF domain-containing protein, partial [Propionibacteriaceae bacterium]|nr:SAF domain-containing protein [Propionibacteriaceae bacterium]
MKPPTPRGPQLRRSPLLVVTGIVLVITGALVSVGIYTNLSRSQEVIAIVAGVARGERIERADLATVRVGFDPLLTPVPAADINDVVGQFALSDLVPGTFLTPDAVGGRISPADGLAEIGLALTAGEYPDD